MTEDNNDIHAILTSLFEKEHEVYSTYSGTEGLAERNDLVLAGYHVTGKAKTLKFAGPTASAILMLTALGEAVGSTFKWSQSKPCVRSQHTSSAEEEKSLFLNSIVASNFQAFVESRKRLSKRISNFQLLLTSSKKIFY